MLEFLKINLWLEKKKLSPRSQKTRIKRWLTVECHWILRKISVGMQNSQKNIYSLCCKIVFYGQNTKKFTFLFIKYLESITVLLLDSLQSINSPLLRRCYIQDWRGCVRRVIRPPRSQTTISGCGAEIGINLCPTSVDSREIALRTRRRLLATPRCMKLPPS